MPPLALSPYSHANSSLSASFPLPLLQILDEFVTPARHRYRKPHSRTPPPTYKFRKGLAAFFKDLGLLGALELEPGELEQVELEWAIGLPPLNCDVGGVEREIAGWCHGGNEGGVL